MDLRYVLCESTPHSHWDTEPENKRTCEHLPQDMTEEAKAFEPSRWPAPEPRSLTQFPARSFPDPKTSADLRDRPVKAPKSPWTTCKKIDRWYCCKCIEGDVNESPVHSRRNSSFEDDGGSAVGVDVDGRVGRNMTGIIYSDTGACSKCDECGHRKCCNCGLGTFMNRYTSPVVRTVGGLHVSPRHIDPVYWECVCGEWEGNPFNARCVFGEHDGQGGAGTTCSSPCCCVANPWGRHLTAAGHLTRLSVVLNKYGQRLGTADQSVMVTEGPWHYQRRALGDRRCALPRNMRPRPFRVERSPTTTTGEPLIWRKGGDAPEYPDRPGPPDPKLDLLNGDKHFAYEGLYLDCIAAEPSCQGKDLETDNEHASAVDMMELREEGQDHHDIMIDNDSSLDHLDMEGDRSV